jgi:hypothetical protein
MFEELDGEGDKGSGDTTIVHAEILLEAHLKDFWTCECFPHLLKF